MQDELKGIEKGKKSTTLLPRIMLPMIIIALLQSMVFVAIMISNGGFSHIKKSAYSLLDEKTGNRKNFVENEFNKKTSMVYGTANGVNETLSQLLTERGSDLNAIKTDKELNKLLLSCCSESLISLIRQDMVNDAFIILDTGTLYDEDGKKYRPGLYLRDTDVNENSASDNKDIFMEMGSSQTARTYGLALDFGWSLNLDVTDEESGSNDFFYKPIDTYADFSDKPVYNLGYWSGFSAISDSQQSSVKYTLPLVMDGKVYGVIGIGLLEKTILKSIPATDFNSESNCYVLGIDLNEDGRYVKQLHQGSSYLRLEGSNSVFGREREAEYGLYDFTFEDCPETVGCIKELNLYNSGSPYKKQKWALISVADKKETLKTYYSLLKTVLISVLISLIISVFTGVMISRKISLPVKRMAGTLNKSRVDYDLVEFHSTGIKEIDSLAAAIVELQIDVTEYASRVSRIITMSGSRLGVFMYDGRSESVFVGESLVKLLEFTTLPERDVTITAEEFKKQLKIIDKDDVIVGLPIFGFSNDEDNMDQSLSDSREIKYTDSNGVDTWLKFTLTRDNTNVMGLVEDITNTVEEKHMIAKVKDDEYTAKLIETNAALREAYASAKHASSAKTDFLSRMSHDIRTPMNAIIGMTLIAKTHLDDKEKLKSCFEKISVSSNYLLSLINEVLDMSKIEGGKFVLAEEKINIIELVENLVEIVKPTVKEKKHELKLSVTDVKHKNVIGDTLRIQQVFMNIISNSVKYTHVGGHIGISISEKETGQKKVGFYEFVFTDDGKGMTQEFIEKIFVPFEREEDERVSKEQGTGLGMTIAYNIVKMMDGDIKVESRVNEGSTFTVTLYLPIDSEAEDENTASKGSGDGSGGNGSGSNSGNGSGNKADDGSGGGSVSSSGSGSKNGSVSSPGGGFKNGSAGSSGGGPKNGSAGSLGGGSEGEGEAARLINEDLAGCRVLLADDNELNREIAEEILEMAKLRVETVKNGKEAVEEFQKSSPGYYDFILMDVQMPVMNGYEATRAIRRLSHKDAKTIPIIAMTANAFAEDVKEAENAGMNAHIPKPLDLGRMFETLEKLVEPKR